MMARLRTLAFIGFAMLASMAATTALALPTSAIYVTDFDGSVEDASLNPYGVSVLQMQTGTLTATDSWRHGPLLGTPPYIETRDLPRAPIAVAGQIDVAGPYNHSYNLDGTGQVSTICFPCSFLSYATDGTTDGTYNYTIGQELGPGGDVGIWRTDRSWGGEEYRFDLPLTSTEKAYGITYDPTNNSLWVLAVDRISPGGTTSRVLELGLDGTLKSQFAGFGTANGGPYGIVEGALAMDYSDNTLWWLPLGTQSIDPDPNDQFNPVYINQFSTTGQFLSSAPLAATRWIYGAEFNLPISNRVPEPGSLVLLAVAAGAMVVVRRRITR